MLAQLNFKALMTGRKCYLNLNHPLFLVCFFRLANVLNPVNDSDDEGSCLYPAYLLLCSGLTYSKLFRNIVKL